MPFNRFDASTLQLCIRGHSFWNCAYNQRRGPWGDKGLHTVVGSLSVDGVWTHGGPTFQSTADFKSDTTVDYIGDVEGYSHLVDNLQNEVRNFDTSRATDGNYNVHCWLEDKDGNIFDFYDFKAFTEFSTPPHELIEGMSKHALAMMGVVYMPAPDATQVEIMAAITTEQPIWRLMTTTGLEMTELEWHALSADDGKPTMMQKLWLRISDDMAAEGECFYNTGINSLKACGKCYTDYKEIFDCIGIFDDHDEINQTLFLLYNALPWCAHCDKQDPEFKCPCDTAFYCNEACQTAHWRSHKPAHKRRAGLQLEPS